MFLFRPGRVDPSFERKDPSKHSGTTLLAFLLAAFSLLFFPSSRTIAGSGGEFPVDTLDEGLVQEDGNRKILLKKPWVFWKSDAPVEELDPSPENWDLVELPLREDPFGKGEDPRGCLGKHLYVPDSSAGKRFGLFIKQWGACEIYIDEERFASVGSVGKSSSEEVRKRQQISPPLYLRFEEPGIHEIHIRFSDYAWKEEKGWIGRDGIGVIEFYFLPWKDLVDLARSAQFVNAVGGGIGAFFAALGFLHLLIFLFYRKKSSNFYYSIFMLLYSGIFLLGVFLYNSNDPRHFLLGFRYYPFLMQLFFVGLLTLIYSMLRKKGFGAVFWIILGLWGLLWVAYSFGGPLWFGLSFLIIPAVLVEGLRVIVISLVRGEKGSWILGLGAGFFILFLIGAVTLLAVTKGNLHLEGPIAPVILLGALFSIPLSMSLYLARDFATTSKGLERKLEEVEELNQKNLEQEREKQRILEEKKEELEEKVQERTQELRQEKERVEEAHQEIRDSIDYAQGIQEAVLPEEERYEEFGEHFIFFRPRDPVSGDFHWGRKEGEHFYIAAVDCTGHGVPGAFMSMLGVSYLNEIMANEPDASAGDVLTYLKQRVVKELSGRKGTAKDGMDAAILKVTKPKSQTPKSKKGIEVEFAGANNPLYWIRASGEEEIPDELAEERIKPFKDHPSALEIQGDKGAIGYEEKGVEAFRTVRFQATPGDSLYIFSDGYADQFGGPKGKKFRYGAFKRLLVDIADKPMAEQKAELERKFEEWKGEREQVDDVLVMGVRV